MNLKEVILHCNNYSDSDETVNLVFAKLIDDSFNPLSEALVIELTLEEIELDLQEIENIKCPGYKYFLEIDIMQDFFNDIKNMPEFKSDDSIVNRVIYYAENDA